ncbi:LysR family transcriptional regulator [Streptacidiphilus jiangxiensis]|uniref:ModE molybdate transport repressor domain-containing protein n=1 Tax=Streptacidiphilus jiangxiensis TaxID=235985 RepID=A0A1H7PUI5_STRJI|nr:LysR family transcriptional regulator [Streptacidiphilus jiangxiensis]SEL38905.1 ModE molybdate transport repressor domain-containing protein [Streptacidiphilus jiangxiensis]
MIDVQRLAVLREVSRQGSFNQAAGVLRLTPSAVSQQIAALERRLGSRVVERSTRGVVLTEAGRLLVDAAEAIAAELADAQQRIDRLAQPRQTLTVATFASGGRHLLPGVLGGFVADHPEAELTIVEAEPEESLPLVREGRVDVALAYHFDGPPPARPGDRTGLDWAPLLDDPLRVVLPRAHPRAGGPATVDLADLAGERWVLGCLKSAAQLARYAELAGVELSVSCSSTDYAFAQSLVRAGVGIALIPQIAVERAPDLVALTPASPAPVRHIGLARARRHRGPADRLTDELSARLRAAVAADAGAAAPGNAPADADACAAS